uniref:Uncharacterized protein n=1 Tax=Romanomermis culicivorax TaxID=13658 RepID=A0A915HKL5_ROMCU
MEKRHKNPPEIVGHIVSNTSLDDSSCCGGDWSTATGNESAVVVDGGGRVVEFFGRRHSTLIVFLELGALQKPDNDLGYFVLTFG